MKAHVHMKNYVFFFFFLIEKLFCMGTRLGFHFSMSLPITFRQPRDGGFNWLSGFWDLNFSLFLTRALSSIDISWSFQQRCLAFK